MIIRIDHVSLAVKDYEGALEFFTKVFGATSQFYGTDNILKYYWETLALGDLSRLELIKPTEEGSFLENFLKNKEGGIHHLVLQTTSIESTKKVLEENSIPYFGFRISEKWKELFVHPKDAYGVLLQIAEFRPEDWLDPSYGMPEGKKWEVIKNGADYCITFGHPGGGKVEINLIQEEVKQLIHDLNKFVD
jgi:methylmalonyl-CoA/ethylmalonyl-CoA epimerase